MSGAVQRGMAALLGLLLALLAGTATAHEMSMAEMSLRALSNRAGSATGHLMQAHGRYQGTRSALRSYTVDLESFHADATAAIERETTARYLAHEANLDLTEAAHHARSAAMNPDDQATIDHWHTQAHLARLRVDTAEDAIAAAQSDYSKAADALEQAAQRAMGLIDASFDGTDDSRLDRMKNAFGELASMLSNLAVWAVEVLKTAVEAVVLAVAIFIAAVLIVIAVVNLMALVMLLLVASVAVIINMIVGLAATVVLLLAVGAVAYHVASELGVDDLTRIRIVLAAVAVACPALGYFLVQRIRDELFKPAPKVTLLDPKVVDDHDASRVSAAEQALAAMETNEPDSVDDFLWQAGAVDTIGGEAQTVVDIAKIVHEDGSVSWIVTLPSTKDWVVPSDTGAVNDLDADLLLMAFPELKSQYEKAVLDAMAQAGIGITEPVLLTGWSLGGILAGHLAETGAGGYDYAGLVVAGSPIDHMDIAADIPVIQVKHMNDPVHRGDMIDDVPDRGSHISVWDGARSGIGLGRKTGTTLGHDAGQYYDTLESHVAANESINDAFRDFYVVDDPNHTGKPTIEHTQYAFSE